MQKIGRPQDTHALYVKASKSKLPLLLANSISQADAISHFSSFGNSCQASPEEGDQLGWCAAGLSFRFVSPVTSFWQMHVRILS